MKMVLALRMYKMADDGPQSHLENPFGPWLRAHKGPVAFTLEHQGPLGTLATQKRGLIPGVDYADYPNPNPNPNPYDMTQISDLTLSTLSAR